MSNVIFHLAIPVHNIELAKRFYRDGLGFQLGRETEHALIINFGGAQLVGHLVEKKLERPKIIYPRHFGLVFSKKSDLEALIQRARDHQLEFYSEPKTRYPGQVTEHDSVFLLDPSNNLIEFKYYKNESAIMGATHVRAIGDE